MNFSQALSCLKKGQLLQREGWNGKGMFIFKVNGSTFDTTRPPLSDIFGEDSEITYSPHADMKTEDGTITPWLCSQADLFAEDWQTVEHKTGEMQWDK